MLPNHSRFTINVALTHRRGNHQSRFAKAEILESTLILLVAYFALAGFLFGFDVVVISGAENDSGSLGNERPASRIRHRCSVVGNGTRFVAWFLAHRQVRAKDYVDSDRLLVSGVGSLVAFATDPTSFMIARFIGGIGVGVSTIAAPLYISEISPPENRGWLAGMFQFNIVFGIMIGYGSNYLIKTYGGEDAWRWMMGIERCRRYFTRCSVLDCRRALAG